MKKEQDENTVSRSVCVAFIVAGYTLVWCPDPSQKIRARVNACAREGEKGLVNNYASPRAKAGMLEQVLVCKH